MRRLLPGLALGLLPLLPLLNGCTGAASSPAPTPAASAPRAPAAPASAPPPPATPTSATPAPATSPAAPTSPFTGLPADPDAPVVVVKMDNTTFAQPHAGLTQADLVILEPVEYGLTRIAAVFSAHLPSRVGPVRSARITDIDLASLLGHPALVFSGAQRLMYPILKAAPIDLVSPAIRGTGFGRDHRRHAPYNEFVDTQVARRLAPDSLPAHDIGFTFSADVPQGGTPATHARVTWPSSSATFDYDATTGLYRVRMNGGAARAEEDPIGQRAASVIIQFVDMPDSVFHDKFGGITPRAHVIGTGVSVILRDGRAYEVTWSRPTANSPITFAGADGSPVPLHPGQQWLVLADITRESRIRATIGAPSPGASAQAATPASAHPSQSRTSS